MYATLARKSANKKLGETAATWAARQSCPSDCALAAECYGNGFRTRTIWDRMTPDSQERTHELRVRIAQEEAARIDAVSRPSRDLRLHVVGDCAIAEAAAIVSAAAARYVARAAAAGHTVRVWTYTHAWRTVPRDAWGTVSVLASCESVDDVAAAQARGYATARVVAMHPADGKAYGSEAGMHVPCPEQTGRAASCAECRLCWDDVRLRSTARTIAFAAHGDKARALRDRLAV